MKGTAVGNVIWLYPSPSRSVKDNNEEIDSVLILSSISSRYSFKDDNFDAENINRGADDEGMIEATRVVDGMQISGCLILPHYFVEISKYWWVT